MLVFFISMAVLDGKRVIQFQHQNRTVSLVVVRKESGRIFEAHLAVEEINKAHGTDLRVISHALADTLLTTSPTLLCHDQAPGTRALPEYSFVVDMLVAHETPGVPLSDKIVLNPASLRDSDADKRPIILLTGRHRGQTNVALAAEGLQSDNFDITATEIRVLIPDHRLIVVPDFPRFGLKLYPPHDPTGIPHGDRPDKPDKTHRLLVKSVYNRDDDRAYVGMVVRTDKSHALPDDLFETRHVDMSYSPNYNVGVVAVVPDVDVAKVQPLLSP